MNTDAFSQRPRTVAHLIAEFLLQRGIRRIFGLTGGHIKPIWDESSRAGIEIISVRHEAAAVHMAQAHADLCHELGSGLGVATVTTGPGLTNAITGIAAADKARSPLLVLCGLPPRPQIGMKSLEDFPHVDAVKPFTRYADTVMEPRHILWKLDAAVAAALGSEGKKGPALLDIPLDVLRTELPNGLIDERWFAPRPPSAQLPDPGAVLAARARLNNARRILVISGKSALLAKESLNAFLDKTGAMYLDTKESRGLVDETHPAYVPAMRAKAMAQCDLVITLGRELDYELGYGSPALFVNNPAFIRIGASSNETSENRRGEVEIRADVDKTLQALLTVEIAPQAPDDEWREVLQQGNEQRRLKLQQTCATHPHGNDGAMHPYRMLSVVNAFIQKDSIVIVDGGDIFSFARVALKAPTYLDSGVFGCLGVGVPYAVSAALAYPQRRVVLVTGDGAFGFNALELQTAVRNGAKIVVVVANNGAWNIERVDQIENFGANIVGTEIPDCRYDLLAKGLGAYGERVESIDELQGALERGFANAPALIDVKVTRDTLSPDFSSGLAEIPDYQPLRTWNDVEVARGEI